MAKAAAAKQLAARAGHPQGRIQAFQGAPKSGCRQKEVHMPDYLKIWKDQQTTKLDASLAKMQKAIGSMEGAGKGLGGGAVATASRRQRKKLQSRRCEVLRT